MTSGGSSLVPETARFCGNTPDDWPAAQACRTDDSGKHLRAATEPPAASSGLRRVTPRRSWYSPLMNGRTESAGSISNARSSTPLIRGAACLSLRRPSHRCSDNRRILEGRCKAPLPRFPCVVCARMRADGITPRQRHVSPSRGVAPEPWGVAPIPERTDDAACPAARVNREGARRWPRDARADGCARLLQATGTRRRCRGDARGAGRRSAHHLLWVT